MTPPLPFGLSTHGDVVAVLDEQAQPPDAIRQLAAALARQGLLALFACLTERASARAGWPADVTARLDASLVRGRAVAMRWDHALARMGQAFAAAQVPVAVFKGADLSFHAYPEPGLRKMADADILVEESALGRARDVLRSLGFEQDTSCYSQDWYECCLQQLPPMADARGIEIDAHGALVSSYSPHAVPDADVWAGMRPSRWPGILRLGRVWAVWHLAMHGAIRHGAASGAASRAVVDLLALLAHVADEPIDWPALLALADRTGLAFAVSDLLAAAVRQPGTACLQPFAAQAASLAHARRVRERRLHVVHRIRHATPFLGTRMAVSPEVVMQVIRRPLRLLRGRLAARD